MPRARIDRPAWFSAAAMIANGAAVLFAFALVWIPEARLYWIGFPKTGAKAVASARSEPSKEVLDEVGSLFLGFPVIDSDEAQRSPDKLLHLAQEILAGVAPTTAGSFAPSPFPFRASNLEAGLPTQQLVTAGMGTAHVLLQAYHLTGENRYLDGALQEALAFAKVDRWRLVPLGFLWNDHALAARIAVIADLWSLVRSRGDVDEQSARTLLELADRSAARLGKPELFTFRTNHGVMQSIALLQFAAAFPTLERASESRALGCARLTEQIPYYIDADGITLEHSLGYHELGRRLLSIAIRLFKMNSCPIPPDWPLKLDRATEFSHLISRPDGTLPAIGNTDHAPVAAHRAVDLTTPPRSDFAVFPSAGFAISWRGLAAWPDPTRLAQTAVTWSNFPSGAHKLADDMSVVVWAAGRPWLTNSGYWPYGVAGYNQATGWRGSNAPHLTGEEPRSERSTVLRLFGKGPRASLLDLERKVTGTNISIRRQVVEIDGSTWIVVDSVAGEAERTVDRIWTTMPETQLQRVSDREYLMTDTTVPAVARVSFLGELSAPPQVRTGEVDPFSGWIVRGVRPTPAPSFQVRQRGPGLAVTVLTIGDQSREVPMLEKGLQEPDNWSVVFRDSKSQRSVQRIGERLTGSSPSGGDFEVQLSPVAPDAVAQRQYIVTAFQKAARKYPKHRELTYYRYKLSWLFLGLIVAQELSIFAIRRWSVTAGYALRAAATTSWIVVGLVAFFIYLR